MVHSVTPEDDCKIFDRALKAKRFTYQSNNAKVDPWKKFNVNGGCHSTGNPLLRQHTSQTKQYTYLNPHQNKGFNLDKVWSIRNNVPFQNQNTNTRKDDALPTNPSNYSRYKPNPATSQWSARKQSFSKDQPKDSNIFRENKNNMVSSGGKDSSTRQMSARTHRAHKLHQAHLKSRGLGEHATSTSTYHKQDDVWKKEKHNRDDEFDF